MPPTTDDLVYRASDGRYWVWFNGRITDITPPVGPIHDDECLLTGCTECVNNIAAHLGIPCDCCGRTECPGFCEEFE